MDHGCRDPWRRGLGFHELAKRSVQGGLRLSTGVLDRIRGDFADFVDFGRIWLRLHIALSLLAGSGTDDILLGCSKF